MEPGGSIPHSQGVSNNPYPEPNQPNSPQLDIIIILNTHTYLKLNPYHYSSMNIPLESKVVFDHVTLKSKYKDLH